MNKYGVWVTRHITESAFVVVEAEDADDAETKAIDMKHGLDYETDDYPPYDYDYNVELLRGKK